MTSPATVPPLFPGSVTEISGELPWLGICNNLGRARVFLHGAHVASFRPVGEGEVLWMSLRSAFAEGKAIRGGVPLCFPWFGPYPGKPDLPQHGFARLHAWNILGAEDLPDGRTRVRLGFSSSPQSLFLWPHNFALVYSITVGAELELVLQITNTGAAPFSCEEALHTYFDVGDVRKTSVSGLEGALYLDRAQGDAPKTDPGAIHFASETVRIFPGTTATCQISDVVAARQIVVAKQGSQTTVVWNPWVAKAAAMPDFGDHEWAGMVCVEAANAGDARLTLQAGQSHTMSQTISVRRT